MATWYEIKKTDSSEDAYYNDSWGYHIGNGTYTELLTFKNTTDKDVLLDQVTLQLGTGNGTFWGGGSATGYGTSFNTHLKCNNVISDIHTVSARISVSSVGGPEFYDTWDKIDFIFQNRVVIAAGSSAVIYIELPSSGVLCIDKGLYPPWNGSGLMVSKSTVTCYYNLNGGHGASSQTLNRKEETHLTSQTPYWDDNKYLFAKWTFSPTGVGISFQPGDPIYINSEDNITLITQWKTVLTYDANDGSNPPEGDETLAIGSNAITLPTGENSRPYYNRLYLWGWGTDPNYTASGLLSYDPGFSYGWSLGSNTLYALWGHRIQYESNGGQITAVGSGGTISPDGQQAQSATARYQNIAHQDTLTIDCTCERLNYTLVGWNTQPDGSGTQYTNGQIFSQNGSDPSLYSADEWPDSGVTILYAIWRRNFSVYVRSNGQWVPFSEEYQPADPDELGFWKYTTGTGWAPTNLTYSYNETWRRTDEEPDVPTS